VYNDPAYSIDQPTVTIMTIEVGLHEYIVYLAITSAIFRYAYSRQIYETYIFVLALTFGGR
jgi:NADH:ubiquinone oxidoreductase subunit K